MNNDTPSNQTDESSSSEKATSNSLEAIMAANKAKAEKQRLERKATNAQVLRSYNIKHGR